MENEWVMVLLGVILGIILLMYLGCANLKEHHRFDPWSCRVIPPMKLTDPPQCTEEEMKARDEYYYGK